MGGAVQTRSLPQVRWLQALLSMAAMNKLGTLAGSGTSQALTEWSELNFLLQSWRLRITC